MYTIYRTVVKLFLKFFRDPRPTAGSLSVSWRGPLPEKIDAGRQPRLSRGMVAKALKEADTRSTLTVLLN
jgi:hypothetical protein